MAVHACGKSIAERVIAHRQSAYHRKHQRNLPGIHPEFKRPVPGEFHRERAGRALPGLQCENDRRKFHARPVEPIVQNRYNPPFHPAGRIIHRAHFKPVLPGVADRIPALEGEFRFSGRRILPGLIGQLHRLQPQRTCIPVQDQIADRIRFRHGGDGEGIFFPLRRDLKLRHFVPPVISFRIPRAGAQHHLHNGRSSRLHPAGKEIPLPRSQFDIMRGKLHGVSRGIREVQTVLAVNPCGSIPFRPARCEIRGGIRRSGGDAVLRQTEFKTGVAKQIFPGDAPAHPGSKAAEQNDSHLRNHHGSSSRSMSFNQSSSCSAGIWNRHPSSPRFNTGYVSAEGRVNSSFSFFHSPETGLVCINDQ